VLSLPLGADDEVERLVRRVAHFGAPRAIVFVVLVDAEMYVLDVAVARGAGRGDTKGDGRAGDRQVGRRAKTPLGVAADGDHGVAAQRVARVSRMHADGAADHISAEMHRLRAFDDLYTLYVEEIDDRVVRTGHVGAVDERRDARLRARRDDLRADAAQIGLPEHR